MLLRHTGRPEDIVLQFLPGVCHVHHQEGQQEHPFIAALQIPEDVLCLPRVGCKVGRDDINVKPFPGRPLLGVDLHAVQVRDLPFDGLDGFVLVQAPDVEAHKNGTVRIQQVGQYPVIELRCRDLQKTGRAVFPAHLEPPGLAEAEGGRDNKILHMEAGRRQPVPFKGEALPVRMEDAMQHRQPFPAVQRLCQRTHDLEMAQPVQDDPGKPGPGGLNIRRLDGQHQEFCLDHAVVAMFQLRPEHFRIKGAYPVEGVPLGGNLDPFPEIRPVHLPAHKGQLHADRGIMGVIHIT